MVGVVMCQSFVMIVSNDRHRRHLCFDTAIEFRRVVTVAYFIRYRRGREHAGREIAKHENTVHVELLHILVVLLLLLLIVLHYPLTSLRNTLGQLSLSSFRGR